MSTFMENFSFENDNVSIASDFGFQVYEERVKIDRKKLEQMLAFNLAEKFFTKISEEFPLVKITWPRNIKIGTKARKDPQVKISGSKDSVKMAKKKVLQVFNEKKHKILLKVDLDWTVHSTIIGKSGMSIQKVMNETNCRIHLPDANRNKENLKSNQVSINGFVKNVQEARIKIKQLAPISVMVCLAASENDFEWYKCVKLTEDIRNSNVLSYLNQKKSSGFIKVYAIVKGTRAEISKLKNALMNLSLILADCCYGGYIIEYSISRQVPLRDHKEIKSQLKQIERETLTKIYINDMAFTINGRHFNDVLLALDKLENHLSATLTFDLDEDDIVDEEVIRLAETLFSVKMVIKPKTRQNSRTVWLTTRDHNWLTLFSVRDFILMWIDLQKRQALIGPMWPDSQLQFECPRKSRGNSTTDFNVPFDKAPGANRFCGMKKF